MTDLRHQDERSGLEIAIIGMAGRFPGAPDIETLWQNLCAGIESVVRLSDDELREAGVDPRSAAQPNYVAARAVLDDIELFDADFFGFAPREAAALDPQHRLFLECAWAAFEHAGYDPERVTGPVGVYAGSGLNGYQSHLFPDGLRMESAADMAAMLALDKDFLATRVSYKLNLRGPSLAVQTACSTSLVAVHVACQALLSGECDMALAGGVSIGVPQKVGYLYQEGGIASPDGHCRPFDAAAQGTVAGSGVGVVLLKRLDDALEDGDAIVAIIKGSAINNDGKRKVGFTAPGMQGQTRVIRDAQRVAGVKASTIGYVEAHGTGTPFGDPIEIAALTEAFRASSSERAFCGIGSLKGNIGHLDAAAGVTGLIKAALVVDRGAMPPSLHFRAANPAIDFDSSPFRVVSRLTEWPDQLKPRRAGVSSFGLGGTNAHVVLEQPPVLPVRPDETSPELLLLSARSQSGLRQLCSAVAERLAANCQLTLADVAHTLRVGRRAFPFRRALVTADRTAAIEALRTSHSSEAVAQARPVAFLFPGQGAQHPHAARDLYESDATFKEELDRLVEQLEPRLGVDLRTLLFPVPERLDEARAELARTVFTQPVMFACEYTLAQWWMRLGLRPEAMLGHSVGEYVAACVAGSITLEHALDLVVARGRLMEATPEGAMLAVSAAERELRDLLHAELSLAAVNSARQCVLSGTLQAVTACEHALAQRGVSARRLRTRRAFHSSLMDGVLAAFGEAVAKVPFQAPRIPWVSNVTGTWITEAQACDPNYWVRHLREPVRFAAGLATLRERPERVLLEVGPGQTLTRLCRQAAVRPAEKASAPPPLVVASLPHDGQGSDPGLERVHRLRSCGELWSAGVPLELEALVESNDRRRVHLPTTPFERQRHWLERPAREQAASAGSAASEAHSGPWYYAPSWKRAPRSATPPRQDEPAHWLVLADERNAGLAHAFARSGLTITCVRPGEAFRDLGAGRYTVRAHDSADYAALLGALRTPPSVIVHALAAELTSAEPTDTQALLASQRREAASLIALAKALGHLPARLLVLTCGIADVTGAERLTPERGPLLGLCRTVALEYPQGKCRLVDVEPSMLHEAALDTTVQRLVREAHCESAERVVALRGSHRWLEALEPIVLDTACSAQSLLRSRGVYLITGGRGALGFEVAELLTRSGAGGLILMGRTAPTAAQLERIRSFKALGARVMLVEADVSDPEAVREALVQVLATFGALHGVVHAAGVAEGGFIASLSADKIERELSAKAAGAQVLLSQLRELQAYDRLDFVLLCSSLTSLSGGVAQAGYAAANAFLDVLAQSCAREHGPYVVSLAFDRLRGLGMAARAEARLRASGITSLSFDGLSAQDGQDAVARVLSQRLMPHVVVSARRLVGMPRDEEGSTLAAELGLIARERSNDATVIASEAALDPSLPLQARMAALWADAFGVPQVDPHRNFFELGGESLLALQVLNRVRVVFSVEIPLREFFEHASAAALADLVRSRQSMGATAGGPALVAIPRAPRRARPGPQTPAEAPEATHDRTEGDD